MKLLFLTLMTLFCVVLTAPEAAAQNGKKAVWKEMHDFHDVMSEAFHSAEDKNFEPLKEKSSLLLDRAKAWQQSAVPAGYKPDITAEVLKRLVKQCKKLNKMVKKGAASDAELFAAINTAHDIFHEIMEKCREK